MHPLTGCRRGRGLLARGRRTERGRGRRRSRTRRRRDESSTEASHQRPSTPTTGSGTAPDASIRRRRVRRGRLGRVPGRHDPDGIRGPRSPGRRAGRRRQHPRNGPGGASRTHGVPGSASALWQQPRPSRPDPQRQRRPTEWLKNAIALTDRVVHGIDRAVQDLARPAARASMTVSPIRR